MKLMKCQLLGDGPILMHSDRLSDPLDAQAKKHKTLTSVLKKTDEVHLAIAVSEFRNGMYYDPELGPYIPGENLQATFKNGAKLNRLGAAFDRGLIVLDEKCQLSYQVGGQPGARSMEAMEADFANYTYRKSVVVDRKRLWRVRPIFREWQLTCTIQFEDTILEEAAVQRAVINAGKMIGLCDWRPRFGRFNVEFL